MIDFRMDAHVASITMQNGENRFNPSFLTAFLSILDQIENTTDARTLVVDSAHEKIFSNGIDLDWLIPVLQNRDMETAKQFFYSLNRLYKRILLYPLVTIAAITGHAFAGGAILCCAFDFRFMRTDRGFFCFPEVDLGIPFLPGMNALLKKAIPMYKLQEMQLLGSRLTATECKAHNVVREAYPHDTLMNETLAFAKTIKKNRRIVAELKNRLYSNIVKAIDVEDIPYIESGQYHIE
ncbi:MAG: enoyl-CoA hydratase/isomerase family protein [Desulfobacterales bacterium]|nr:enoyl-CoA hydratase/isomerase family protein [Desulfobacterales bacterium]